MRLHVLSDLHLEHEPFVPPEVDADLTILAGDTAPGVAGVAWARRVLDPRRPVLYLAGNHEYYGHRFPSLIDELRAAAAGSQVQILERDEVTIDGVGFLGGTLWTDFATAGAERREQTMRFSERVSNDYRLISSAATGGPLRAAETLADHRRTRAWLAKRLARSQRPSSVVVITHHVPLPTRRTENLALQALAGSILSDLGELIDAWQPALWIHGHSHRAADRVHGATRILSNPRGYPSDRNRRFDPGLVLSV